MTEKQTGRRASLAMLTFVELRKLVDTRAGIAICVVSAVLAGVCAVLAVMYRQPASIDSIAQLAAVPGSTLVPVLAILLVTAERTHHTALATYALTPQRHRILLAKIGAAVMLAAAIMPLALLVAVVLGPIGSLLTGDSIAWTVDVAAVGKSALVGVLMALTGCALALAIGNAPASIVIILIWPMVEGVLLNASPTLGNIVSWIDILAVTEDVARGATALTFWILLPFVIGFARTLRSEVR